VSSIAAPAAYRDAGHRFPDRSCGDSSMPDEPTYLTEFKKVARSSPSLVFDHLSMISELYHNISDRASIILQTSMVQNNLTMLIRKKTRDNLNNKQRNRLFDGNGPLASFGNQLIVSYAFGIFGPVSFRDLDLIREIRNGFAHSRYPMQFSMREVTNICMQLKIVEYEKLVRSPVQQMLPLQQMEFDLSNPKYRFATACYTFAAWFIEMRVNESPFSLQHEYLP
jgi:DNA-binding MltR family transcriptional regulator